jgi:hypothetical protein
MTGLHARGHNRSGIIWFLVVAITGIFGFAFYLLAITSDHADEVERNGAEIDKKLGLIFPKYLLSSLGGAVGAVLIIRYGISSVVHITRSTATSQSPPAALFLLIIPLFFIGLIGAPWLVSTYDWKKLAYLLTYVPVIIFGISGGVRLLRLITSSSADFHSNIFVISIPVLFAAGGVLSLTALWQWIFEKSRSLLNEWSSKYQYQME